MHRRTSLGATLALILGTQAGAQDMDATKQASFETVMSFMDAMGSGDMETMDKLMADDMVWHSEGDTSLPWVGETFGEEAIFEFLGVFSTNFQTTKWGNSDAFASGYTVAAFGRMYGMTTHSGKEIGEFTFAQRAKVRDGPVVSWNWLEDSLAISQAYHS